VSSSGSKEPLEAYNRIFELLKEHHKWMNTTINLIASENVTSIAVREAMLTDFMHRYAEGWPGERVYAGCIYIDKVEEIAIELAKDLFRAEFADVRPISGVTANLAVYTAFTQPGDTMMALSIPMGGHISMGKAKLGGTAGAVHGLNVVYFRFDEQEMNIDVDKTVSYLEDLDKKGKTPKLALFGGSVFLFPHPVKELEEHFHSRGAIVAYDAAHVAGLIAGKQFQDPLREGADVMTASTHKTLFGPQHGMILSFERYAEKIKKAVFPGVVSNHHRHNVAALAIALCEMKAFGEEYAKQVIKNAKALGQALYERGFKVLAEHKGFTESHTLIIDISEIMNGREAEKLLEESGIIVNRNLLPWDIRMGRHYMEPGGIRLGTSEVTRIGMKESDMEEVAEFMKKVLIDREPPKKVKEEVAEFRKNFAKVHYAFEEANAYQYIGLRGMLGL